MGSIVLLHSKSGVRSNTPVGHGGTLDMKPFTIVGAPAPIREVNPDPTVRSYPAPGVSEPPEYLPEMKDAVIVKHTMQALSDYCSSWSHRNSTVLPVAITHWTAHTDRLCTAKTDPSAAIV